MAFFVSSAHAADAAPPTVAATADPASLPPDAPYELSQEKMFKDTFVFIFLMFAIFYFLLIRPQQKRAKFHQSVLQSLKKGDKVVTGGGIIGTIVKLEGDDVAVVEIAQNVRVRVARNTITERSADSAPASGTANDN